MSTPINIRSRLLLRSSCNHVTRSKKAIWFTLLGIYRAAVIRTVAARRSNITHFVICNLYLFGTSVRPRTEGRYAKLLGLYGGNLPINLRTFVP